MLHESQEEIKELRSKNTPSAGLRRHLSYGLYPMVRETPGCGDLLLQLYNTGVLCLQDSLAAEIEGTMRRELSVEEESAFQDQRYNNQIQTGDS